MTKNRALSLALSCSWLFIGACSSTPTTPSPDFSTTADLRQPATPDLSTPDLHASPPDLTSQPDLTTMACGYGQALSNGVCGCAADHPVACPASYCCAAVQACLSGPTPRCSAAPKRFDHVMAYDPVRDRSLLFGGYADGMVVLGDQEELDPTTWGIEAPAMPPAARALSAATYDVNTKHILLFGGQLANQVSAETFTWDGAAWTKLLPAGTLPPAREGHGMVLDTNRNRVVLFGGANGGDTAYNDVWEWNGTSWLSRVVDTSPDEREGHAMAFDQLHKATVVFGGYSNNTYVNDTWLWDGASWTRALPATSPVGRSGAVAVYDPNKQNTVLFGGVNDLMNLNDTWIWDGNGWTQAHPAHVPPARQGATLIYDLKRKAALLYGGVNELDLLNDVWAWNGTDWTQLY